ncbi:uncharacterized protein LOC133800771 [Humulus lupulus]|uniref:uncharacterized protein LOC133800771 n=1 Tax=Humulus lupulus TaxID=3486 RepID=UPI002B402A2C|nr:uncharacterized protein LOC133800771 [Humulus lupulus]
MSGLRAFSSPDLPSSQNHGERSEDHSFEGISTNVKLLLKLVQDHNEAGTKDDRKTQRVAGMMSILEDLKTRIQKSQSSGRKPELRRCNTDLKTGNNAPRDSNRKPNEVAINDDKEKLKRQLSMSLAARKSLEIMCTSLGKEKEIMASELSRKVQEVAELEELISDLRAQNDMLLGKVKACAVEHKEIRRPSLLSSVGETSQGNAALQERNKALSEQLLKSLDGYRSLKRKLKDCQEDNGKMEVMMEKMGGEVRNGIERIQRLKEKIGKNNNDEGLDIIEDIKALEGMFERFNLKISKHRHKKNESPKNKSETKVSKGSVLE